MLGADSELSSGSPDPERRQSAPPSPSFPGEGYNLAAGITVSGVGHAVSTSRGAPGFDSSGVPSVPAVASDQVHLSWPFRVAGSFRE